MFLTQEELKALSGLQRPSAVKRWLDKERIRYAVGADAWPRVLRIVILERLGGQVAPPPVREPQVRHWNDDPRWNPDPQLVLDGDDGKIHPWDYAKGRKKR